MIVNSRGCETKQALPNVKNYSGVSMEGLRKTTKNLRVISILPRFKPGTSQIQVKSTVAEPLSHFHVLIEQRCMGKWRRVLYNINLSSRR
jgi:hypothetical protein